MISDASIITTTFQLKNPVYRVDIVRDPAQSGDGPVSISLHPQDDQKSLVQPVIRVTDHSGLPLKGRSIEIVGNGLIANFTVSHLHIYSLDVFSLDHI